MTQPLVLTTAEDLEALIEKAVLKANNAKTAEADTWLSRLEAANYLGIGATKLNSIKNTDPDFPKPYGSGKKLQFLKSELDSWKHKKRKIG